MAIERRCIPLVEGPNSCHDILVGSRHTRCQNGRLVPAQNVRPPTNLVASFGGGGYFPEGRAATTEGQGAVPFQSQHKESVALVSTHRNDKLFR